MDTRLFAPLRKLCRRAPPRALDVSSDFAPQVEEPRAANYERLTPIREFPGFFESRYVRARKFDSEVRLQVLVVGNCFVVHDAKPLLKEPPHETAVSRRQGDTTRYEGAEQLFAVHLPSRATKLS